MKRKNYNVSVGEIKTQLNAPERRVRFKVRDVYVPIPSEVMLALLEQQELVGRLVDVVMLDLEGADKGLYRGIIENDESQKKLQLAVIEVDGLTQQLLVPLNKIHADNPSKTE